MPVPPPPGYSPSGEVEPYPGGSWNPGKGNPGNPNDGASGQGQMAPGGDVELSAQQWRASGGPRLHLPSGWPPAAPASSDQSWLTPSIQRQANDPGIMPQRAPRMDPDIANRPLPSEIPIANLLGGRAQPGSMVDGGLGGQPMSPAMLRWPPGGLGLAGSQGAGLTGNFPLPTAHRAVIGRPGGGRGSTLAPSPVRQGIRFFDS